MNSRYVIEKEGRKEGRKEIKEMEIKGLEVRSTNSFRIKNHVKTYDSHCFKYL